MIKPLHQKLIYQDDWLEFYQDSVQFEDGTCGTYAWAKRKNGVAVVVTTPTQKILLHKEYRYVIKQHSWEIQGGGIDQGETAEQAATRELQEEAGITVSETALVKLGDYYPLNSFNTEQVALFMVTIDEQAVSVSGQESSENIEETKFFTFDEVLSMVDLGQINDSFCAHAVQMAIRKFGEPGRN